MFNNVCSYDRKAKVYILRPPSVKDQYIFPSGAQGKMEAYQFWLTLEYPTVHKQSTALVAANPHAERVIWKAAEIAVSNHVEPLDNGRAMVQSSSDPYGRYLVSTNEATDDHLACNCPAYQGLTPVHITIGDSEIMQVCKHSLAVLMFNVTTN